VIAWLSRCSLDRLRLQPGPPTVAAWIAYGCRCDSLNRKKDANTLAILDSEYSDVNLLFVQVRARVGVRVLVRATKPAAASCTKKRLVAL
jgi:hypothetical protein